MEMLHHNFMQCVCTGHKNIRHSPSVYIYYELLLLYYGLLVF